MKDWSKLPEFRINDDKNVIDKTIKDKSRMFKTTNLKKSIKMIAIGVFSLIFVFVIDYINKAFEIQGALKVILFFINFVFIVLSVLLFYGIYYLLLGIFKSFKNK